MKLLTIRRKLTRALAAKLAKARRAKKQAGTWPVGGKQG